MFAAVAARFRSGSLGKRGSPGGTLVRRGLSAAGVKAESTHCRAPVCAAAPVAFRRSLGKHVQRTERLSAALGLHGDAFASVPFGGEQVCSLRFGTGVEPATARVSVWCSTH